MISLGINHGIYKCIEFPHPILPQCECEPVECERELPVANTSTIIRIGYRDVYNV